MIVWFVIGSLWGFTIGVLAAFLVSRNNRAKTAHMWDLADAEFRKWFTAKLDLQRKLDEFKATIEKATGKEK
jgi:hypothetical protein